MDIEKEKVYRAWPSGPPTYQQATSEYVQGITHNRQWNYSLFSCFEPGSLCLMGCFLPCLTFGKTQTRTRNPELSDYSHCNTQCSLFAFLALLGSQWIIQTVKRGETRERFGIEGSCCGDCCVSFCCSCCAIIQAEKEVELRTRPELMGYQMTPGMAYP
ncbi:PLAC8 family protein [Aspergillus ruber CBS 135680]|uniref:PLAC8-domain-containing protein n=1 Tax=Aspergillus ruber (strain CBS 135680) TaxID=1388766 RepID=A0A017S0P3_ASPRC|nr:PLAC8-domain-containing protein [Aspergillus ruber CBS 135680]EYE90416.1 PLAC8-domain-containing protein [Aspergillus ruber CBS 135680]